MSRLIIKTGTIPNDRSGDSLFAAFNKVNANFEELYNITGGSLPDLKELIQDTIAEMLSNGTLLGLTANYNDPANSLSLSVDSITIDGGSASAVFRDLGIIGGNAASDNPTGMLINGGAA